MVSVPRGHGAHISPTVIATVPVGTWPWGVGVNPATDRVYVTNIGSNSVSVIDGAVNAVIATVPVGTQPTGVGVNPATDRVYVTNKASNSVSVIDGAVNAVIATVPVGTWPTGVGVNPATDRVYVANFLTNNVSVINGATNAVIATVPVGKWPSGVGINPASNRVYVANQGSNSVSVIDGALAEIDPANAVIATGPVGSAPQRVGVNPATYRVYVANRDSNSVSVIDGAVNAVIATVPVGSFPFHVGVNPTTDRVYVANFLTNNVSVINGATNAVITTVPVGTQPFGVGVNPATDRVYVTNRNTNSVSVIGGTVIGGTATAVAAGGQHTCALTIAGGVKCWGDNGGGQLGDGTTTDRSTPVDVSGLTSGVAAVAAGDAHTCALTTAGGVKCWGLNVNGELGDGQACGIACRSPVDVCADATCATNLGGVAAVSAGNFHTCALMKAGGLKCWGFNNGGQVGDGSSGNIRTTPVNVAGLTSGVAAVAAGGFHTCALMKAGGLKCWGSNTVGQVGDGTSGNIRSTPVDVCATGASAPCVSNPLSGVAAVSAGAGHTCALMTAGGLKCWGLNNLGRLGDGTTTSRSTPVDVLEAVGGAPLSGVAAVSASPFHTCALMTAGGVKCWGWNNSGQVGDGTSGNIRTTPVDVCATGASAPCDSNLLSGVAAVSAGALHTCALTTAGGVKCWGLNVSGQLGDGTSTDSTTPVDVVLFEDTDGNGLSDSFEDGFGCEGINIDNATSVPPNTASSTGTADGGSTITTGDLTVTLPAGTLCEPPITGEIEIKLKAGPKVEISGVKLVPPATKIVRMPFDSQNVVCIDDNPDATIETVSGGCGGLVQITIPPDGQSNTSGQYKVSRSGSIITIEGLEHTAIAIVPSAVGGTVEFRANADALAEESGSSSARDYATPAAAVAAGAIALVAGGWYARRRWLR